jgi:hypothetical protein
MDAEQIIREFAEKARELITDAENRAAQIVRDAEDEATRIRARAESDARRRLEDVQSAFAELQSRFGTPGAEVEPGPVTVPEPEPPAVPEPSPDPSPAPGPVPVPEPEPPEIPEPQPPPDEGTPPAAGKSSDEAGARLVAMNLALDGISREEALRKLAAEYSLTDLDNLVDDVFSKAGA